jgi:hypothetical protein
MAACIPRDGRKQTVCTVGILASIVMVLSELNLVSGDVMVGDNHALNTRCTRNEKHRAPSRFRKFSTALDRSDFLPLNPKFNHNTLKFGVLIGPGLYVLEYSSTGLSSTLLLRKGGVLWV